MLGTGKNNIAKWNPVRDLSSRHSLIRMDVAPVDKSGLMTMICHILSCHTFRVKV